MSNYLGVLEASSGSSGRVMTRAAYIPLRALRVNLISSLMLTASAVMSAHNNQVISIKLMLDKYHAYIKESANRKNKKFNLANRFCTRVHGCHYNRVLIIRGNWGLYCICIIQYNWGLWYLRLAKTRITQKKRGGKRNFQKIVS